MNHSESQIVQTPPNTWHMLRAMGGLGILCSLLIVFTYQLTLPVVNKKKAAYLEKAIYRVLPGAVTRITYRVTPDGLLEKVEAESRDAQNIYAGYDADNRFVGVAIEAQGQGFQDLLRLLYGYSPEKQAIIGIQVLESKETPGLGDRIEKDPDFLKNFEALDVSLSDDGSQILNPVETVKHGTKTQPWQIDAITGATISSKAVGTILRKSSEQMIPLVAKNVDILKSPH